MTDLKRTGLYDLHLRLGARMVPFAGYEMPVQYPMGVMKEHLHTRAEAGRNTFIPAPRRACSTWATWGR